ncbi:hypothetical protein NDU88_000805 [Pleurodeles waltl]|uniref:Uncharacterized protein n=1 Tax=Pleurodeles waltl TaxID=8319 RepID=A0AAV7LVR6_PLEWA|nr:hypothetical protein NDU88_000805 [Pleurodeles waltl]
MPLRAGAAWCLVPGALLALRPCLRAKLSASAPRGSDLIRRSCSELAPPPGGGEQSEMSLPGSALLPSCRG